MGPQYEFLTGGALPYARHEHNTGMPHCLQQYFMQACHQPQVIAVEATDCSRMQGVTAKGFVALTVQEWQAECNAYLYSVVPQQEDGECCCLCRWGTHANWG